MLQQSCVRCGEPLPRDPVLRAAHTCQVRLSTLLRLPPSPGPVATHQEPRAAD